MDKKHIQYLLLIIVIFIAACIETDIYLPAFADMMGFFSISEKEVQSLLTWNFFGICISGPVYGPLSDAVGRKRPLLIALGLFLAGSLLTLVAHDFSVMLAGRLLQGIGSGGCFALGTAIIFDVFQKKKAVEAIAQINSICPFLMAGAPLLGGYLNWAYGFRSNFLAIAFFVFISLLICCLFFEETLPKEKRAVLHFKKICLDCKEVCTNVSFWSLTCVVSLLFAGYMAFLSTSAVLFVIEMGVGKQLFPIYQAGVLGAWLLASLTCHHSLIRYGTKKIKQIGVACILLGTMAFLMMALLAPNHPFLLTLIMMVYTWGVNWTQGLYFPESMDILPDKKGIAASVLTSARLLITAGTIETASYFYNASIVPLAVILLVISGMVSSLVFFYEKKQIKIKQRQAKI